MHQVGSSIVAAWADISSAFTRSPVLDHQTTGLELAALAPTIGGIKAGYVWMGMNCLVSAAYVRAA